MVFETTNYFLECTVIFIFQNIIKVCFWLSRKFSYGNRTFYFHISEYWINLVLQKGTLLLTQFDIVTLFLTTLWGKFYLIVLPHKKLPHKKKFITTVIKIAGLPKQRTFAFDWVLTCRQRNIYTLFLMILKIFI